MSSDAITIRTGVMSAFRVVVAGSLIKGTKVDGNTDDGGDSESSITLRTVIISRNANC